MPTATYHEIASDYALWCEYVDPGAEGTEEQWAAMTHDERIGIIVACSGDEECFGDEA